MEIHNCPICGNFPGRRSNISKSEFRFMCPNYLTSTEKCKDMHTSIHLSMKEALAEWNAMCEETLKDIQNSKNLLLEKNGDKGDLKHD